MDGGKILVVGDETDILHCGYSHAITHEGRRYPSAEHYAQSMLLMQFKIDEAKILELLSCKSSEVRRHARLILLENIPDGQSWKTLADYMDSARQSFTMEGLRIRYQQDPDFMKALMATKDSLLIVCDTKDVDYGIGMDEDAFIQLANKERLTAQSLDNMLKERVRPPGIGANQLGTLLMWLRYEEREKARNSKIYLPVNEVDGLSTDDDGSFLKLKCNDQIIYLKGIFRPLSNFYPLPMEIKGYRYRSVEHYAYEKLFNALDLDAKCVEKVVTTVNPCDLKTVARKVLDGQKIDAEILESKLAKLDRWRQSAMKQKFAKLEPLQHLLLSTGQSLLVDDAWSRDDWTCGATESGLQTIMAKDKVGIEQIIDWMCSTEPPKDVCHLQGNKCGILLMELREKFAASTPNRIPLTVPPVDPELLGKTSPHIICFTGESVFSPFYPAQIRPEVGLPFLASPVHYVAQETTKYLAFKDSTAGYVNGAKSPIECWRRLYETIAGLGRGFERERVWFMEERQKLIREALRLLFEQHAPLLRALLETGDAFLAYCVRWSSLDAELTIGMRESDLRHWLHSVELDSKQLADLCAKPLAFRPPFLGGNHVGFILMELRTEFREKGASVWALPELILDTLTVLGSDSPTENLMADETFDVLDGETNGLPWANPLLLLAKHTKDAGLLEAARFKLPGRGLVSVDEPRIKEILAKIDGIRTGKTNARFIENLATEELRAVLAHLMARVRGKAEECKKTDSIDDDRHPAAAQVEGRDSRRAAKMHAPPPPPQQCRPRPVSEHREFFGTYHHRPTVRMSAGADRGINFSGDHWNQGRTPLARGRSHTPWVPKETREWTPLAPTPKTTHQQGPQGRPKQPIVITRGDDELSDGELLDSE
ncbi:unnamed protein product, partial [Mesorhabditis spiculigera]